MSFFASYPAFIKAASSSRVVAANFTPHCHRMEKNLSQQIQDSCSTSDITSQPVEAPTTKALTNRLDALLALRGIACFIVVVGHCQPPREVIKLGNYDLSWLIFSPGGTAVGIFFCMSGYLMGKAFFTGRYASNFNGVMNFWRNRILRIFPLYYFAILFQSVLVYPEIFLPQNWLTLLKTLTFTVNELSPVTNPALWSLSTELHFYILVPFIYLFLKGRISKWSHVALTAFLLIFGIYSFKWLIWLSFGKSLNLEEFVAYIYTPVFTNLDLFLCGFIINFCIQLKQDQSNRAKSGSLRARRMALRFPRIAKLFSVAAIVLLYLLAAYDLYNPSLIPVPYKWLVLSGATCIATSFFILSFEAGDAYHERKEKGFVA